MKALRSVTDLRFPQFRSGLQPSENLQDRSIGANPAKILAGELDAVVEYFPEYWGKMCAKEMTFALALLLHRPPRRACFSSVLQPKRASRGASLLNTNCGKLAAIQANLLTEDGCTATS